MPKGKGLPAAVKKKGLSVQKREDCPECGSARIIYSKMTDRYICKDCRAIFSELAPEEEQKFRRVLKS